jgi:hypothetical protein
MAINFKNTKGAAVKNAPDAYKMQDGENKLRIFGDVLSRYVYWVKGTNNKDIPIECLSFDREQEKFTNAEKDLVPGAFGAETKCSWAYSVMCLDPTDGKAKVFNLKKKLFQQVIDASDDLGDPTDADTGWDIVFKKVKTGPLAFNVEYTLSVLKCKPRTLTEDERATIAEAKSIDELIPRPTVANIQALIDRINSGAPAEDAEPDASTAEAIADLS